MKNIIFLILLTFLFLNTAGAAVETMQPTTSTYQVPVKDAALLPYATYAVNSASEDLLSTESVVFWLPEELTGRKTGLFFLQPQADGTWSGAGVKGTCGFKEPNFSCDIKFDVQLNIDLNQVQSILEKNINAFDPTTIRNKLSVSDGFGREPHGILTLRVPENQLQSFRSRFSR